MNSIPQISREIAIRKKLNLNDQKEIQELERERAGIQKELIKAEGEFKAHNDQLSKRERDIQSVEEKIHEGNGSI